MAAIDGSEAFRKHVRWQLECADVFLAVHAPDALGLCRCGRPHPCDERRHWLRMRGHYVNLLDRMASTTDAPGPEPGEPG